MEAKLIKLSDNHYIVVDDSEITGLENNIWVYNNGRLWLWKNTMALISNNKPKKVTHSTQPLEGVIQLNVSDVEEVVYEYIVEDRIIVAAQQYALDNCGDNMSALTKVMSAWKNGFKAHQELTKDKLFTEKDVLKVILQAISVNNTKTPAEIIKSILPPTSWSITIDSNNKITLI